MNQKRQAGIFLIILLLNFGFAKSQTRMDAVRKMSTYANADTCAKLYRAITVTDAGNDDKSKTQKAIDRKTLKNFLIGYNWSPDTSRSNYIFNSILKLDSILRDSVLNGHTNGSLLQSTSVAGSNEPASTNYQAVAINAVATFMANRAEEEVLYYAVDKIFDLANDNTSKVGQTFKTLFPQTCIYIAKLKKGGVYYTSDISIIKQLIEADLRNLPVSMPPLLTTNNLEQDILTAVGESYLIVRDGKNASDLIDSLTERKWKDDNFGSAMSLLEILNNALKAPKGSSDIWLNSSQLANLNPLKFNSNITEQFFYGLLYQQLKLQTKNKIAIEIAKGLSDKTSINVYVQNLNEFDQLGSLLNTFKDSLQKRPKAADVNWIINTTAAGLSFVAAVLNVSEIKKYVKINNSYIQEANNVLQVARFLEQKDYQSAITNLLMALANDPNLSSGDIHKLTFFIQLSEIKDETQFANFLESYAAPIGSSSIKRNSTFNVTLNGYVGLNGGYEQVLNTPNNTTKYDSWFYGVTAPIGVSVTFGGRLTLFGSILDLGSLVNARVQNDSTNYSNLKLNQFLSPGLGIYYNIKSSPFSLGFYGCQINNVRDITYSQGSATITETGKNVVRYTFSLLIDIPFMTLANNPVDDATPKK